MTGPPGSSTLHYTDLPLPLPLPSSLHLASSLQLLPTTTTLTPHNPFSPQPTTHFSLPIMFIPSASHLQPGGTLSPSAPGTLPRAEYTHQTAPPSRPSGQGPHPTTHLGDTSEQTPPGPHQGHQGTGHNDDEEDDGGWESGASVDAKMALKRAQAGGYVSTFALFCYPPPFLHIPAPSSHNIHSLVATCLTPPPVLIHPHCRMLYTAACYTLSGPVLTSTVQS
jgi:hypothetical protein